MKSTRFTFDGSQGVKLAARLDTPEDSRARAFCLFAHCFTCSKNYKAVVNVSKALTARGFGVLRFDFTGLGESEGDFADTNFSSNIEDLVMASDFMAKEHSAVKMLIGHSWGGTAVVRAASMIKSVKAVATIAAPYDPAHVKHAIADKEEEINEKGAATIQIVGRPFKIKKQFLDDVSDEKLRDRIESLNKPLLIFHSPLDTYVSIDDAGQIFKAARHPKSFISLDNADHLLSDERDSAYVGALIAEWASRYL